MTNPNVSQSLLELNGDSGPVEQMWQEFLRNHTDESFSENQRQNARVIFYIASARMYDIFVSVMRADPSMKLMVEVTQAISTDINGFFSDPAKVALVRTH